MQVNAYGVDELFALYERTGFLYPAKAARLGPHMHIVRDNWRRLLQADASLLYLLTSGSEEAGRASTALWRTTHDSWVWQHLVCERNPLHSRAVMLGGLVRCMRLGIGTSQQNWFRPENRFPSRVFGTMAQSLGPSLASVHRHTYLAVPRLPALPMPRGVRIVRCDESHREALCTLAALSRGAVYVTAEELDRDVELKAVDDLYRSVGLRRTRQVWLAYRERSSDILGAALAYRGPLGLNFSFLENRCDLLLYPGLSPDTAAAVTLGLIGEATAAYTDFELTEIPVVADGASVSALAAFGGQVLRDYCQGIWLEDAQPALYRHVDAFYTRLRHRVERSGAASALTA